MYRSEVKAINLLHVRPGLHILYPRLYLYTTTLLQRQRETLVPQHPNIPHVHLPIPIIILLPARRLGCLQRRNVATAVTVHHNNIIVIITIMKKATCNNKDMNTKVEVIKLL
jgi:hypothetical protein